MILMKQGFEVASLMNKNLNADTKHQLRHPFVGGYCETPLKAPVGNYTLLFTPSLTVVLFFLLRH